MSFSRRCRRPSSFWDFLLSGGDGIRAVPADRWSVDRFYDADPAAPGKAIMRRGGFLTGDVRAFDPLFFGISPREAAYMDPQQRLLLEVAHEAMEEGGLVPARLAGANVGVWVGGFALDQLIQMSMATSRPIVNTHVAATAAAMTMLAARIAYAFDFRGPALSIDTACSSSLVALHCAARSLQTGECDVALAGGANVMTSPQYPMVMSKGHFLAPDGHCKSFDARADGYSRGEGAGIVVLKRLDDALRDGDPVHAVLVATGVNQDGHTNGITVPNAEAQAALVRDVAAAGGVDLASVAYVEAHGTGTPVGDPLEARALAETIGRARPAAKPVVIGSVKANIGHLEAAAGVAGFIKACLVAETGVVPPQAGLGEPNPAIPFADWHLALPRTATALSTPGRRFHVAVNSFGYGGTNAHALLKPFDAPARSGRPAPAGTRFLKVTARSEKALAALAARYGERVGAADATDLPAICYSAGERRSTFEHRAVVFGGDPAALLAGLEALAAGGTADNLVSVRGAAVEAPTAWVFSGMGPQWWGMGRHLLAADADFRRAAEAADAIFTALAGWSVLAEMGRDEATSRMGETQVAQPANFIVQTGLAAMLSARGFRPRGDRRPFGRRGVRRPCGRGPVAGRRGARLLPPQPPAADHRRHRHHARRRPVRGRRGGADRVLRGPRLHRRRQWPDRDHPRRRDRGAREDRRGARGGLGLPPLPEGGGALSQPADGAAEGTARRSARRPAAGPDHHSALFHGDRCALRRRRAPRCRLLVPQRPRSRALRQGDRRDDRRRACPVPGGRPEPGADLVGPRLRPGCRRGGHLALHAAALRGRGAGGRSHGRRPDRRGRRGGLARADGHRSLRAAADLSLPARGALGRDRGDGRRPARHTGASGAGCPGGWSRPVFEADVSVNYMPWLPDHRIEDDVVFPAAAYVEAALAAHSAVEGGEGAVLEGLDLRAAMLVDPARRFPLRWSFDPATRTLTAASQPADGSDWRDHASVRVLAARPWAASALDAAALDAAHPEILDVAALYAGLSARGLNYGPAFRAIRALRRGETSVVADLALADGLADEVERYHLHPTLLDGAFQALIAACSDAGARQLFMPVGIRRLLHHRAAGAAVRAVGRLVRQDASAIEGDIRLFAADGTMVAEVLGFTCAAVGAGRSAPLPVERWLFAEEWAPAEPVAAFAATGAG